MDYEDCRTKRVEEHLGCCFDAERVSLQTLSSERWTWQVMSFRSHSKVSLVERCSRDLILTTPQVNQSLFYFRKTPNHQIDKSYPLPLENQYGDDIPLACVGAHHAVGKSHRWCSQRHPLEESPRSRRSRLDLHFQVFGPSPNLVKIEILLRWFYLMI